MNSYTNSSLDLLANQEPLSVLEATATKLELYLYHFNEDDLERSYAAGKWSARQILAHLADAELLFGFRLRQIASEENHSFQLVNQDAWASRYERLEPSLALDAFRTLRLWNLALLPSFDLQDWLKDAYHPEKGVSSMDLFIRLWAAHDLNHLAQLDLIASNVEE